MKAEERIAQLEAEVSELKEQLARALARIHELEGRQKKDSQSSSKPPSSDGLKRKAMGQRKSSGNKSGGQVGHQGHHLLQVKQPDEEIRHRPKSCQHCQHDLETVSGKVVERRQVHELPRWRLVVSEHQVEAVRCPQCQAWTRGEFPPEVKAPAQYGPRVRALAVYLHDYQLVPIERTAAFLQDVLDCPVGEGSIQTWSEQASGQLETTMERIAAGVAASRVTHVDETGAFLGGKLHWIHTSSTRFLTYLGWHEKRGRQALEALGVWNTLSGRVMHDRWASYERGDIAHSLCVAHLLRE
jgi:transposase